MRRLSAVLAAVLLLLVVVVAMPAHAVPRRVRNEFTEAEAQAALAEAKAKGDPVVQEILEVPTGWACSMMCSGVFVAGFPEDVVLVEDVDIARFLVNIDVDYDEKSVFVSYRNSGGYPYKCIFRDGVGCTLIPAGVDEQVVRQQDLGNQRPLPPLNASAEWPEGEFVDLANIPAEVDIEKLRRVVNDDFAVPVYNTRAVVIVYKGKIIHEQYRSEYVTKDSPQLGWSMTKSVTGTIIGRLVDERKLTLEQIAPVPEWADVNEVRHNITIASMMHMSSGLLWRETAPMLPDCLFAEGADCAHYAAMERLRDPIYSVWEYSTGTTTILSRIIAENFQPSQYNIFELYRRTLYDPLGMRTALIEFAPAGYPIGGSYMFASARDWARMGLLYMRGGTWIDGSVIVPRSWTAYSCTPAPTTNIYGAQWWLKEGDLTGICYMSGFRRQNVFNYPEKDLMIVRLSMPKLLDSPVWPEDEFIRNVLSCFPQSQAK